MGSVVPQSGIIQVATPKNPIVIPIGQGVEFYWPQNAGAPLPEGQLSYGFVFFAARADTFPTQWASVGHTTDIGLSPAPILRINLIGSGAMGFDNVSGNNLWVYGYGIPENGFLSPLVASNVPPEGNSQIKIVVA